MIDSRLQTVPAADAERLQPRSMLVRKACHEAARRVTSTRRVRVSRRSASAPHALLNESQRNHLSALAANIEDTLADIERFLDPHLDGDSLLTQYTNDLPVDFDARVRPMLEALRAHVAVFAQQFSLDTRSPSRSSSIAAHVLAQVIELDESGVNQLREYGTVAPRLEPVLAPALEQFRIGFAAISALLTHGGESIGR
jgi:hypothetical protein